MKIRIVATGKCKDKHTLSWCDDYLKRLKPFFKTEIVEVPQGVGEGAVLKRKEAMFQLAKISDNAIVVAMDEHGEQATSREFAKKLHTFQDSGVRELVFVIGGSDGLDIHILERAKWRFSLSKLTFPHMLVRPILLEQLYRAGTILSGHPYHRD